MSKRLSAPVIVALKEVLCSIYWYKADLRSFLQHSLADKSVLAVLNWDAYKRQILSDLVDRLSADQERHVGDLLGLCSEVANLKEFRHLEQLDGGAQKAERARKAVASLRVLLQPPADADRETEEIRQREQRMAEKLKASAAVRERLEDLRRRYAALVISDDNAGARVRA
jgi:hypothetical protein